MFWIPDIDKFSQARHPGEKFYFCMTPQSFCVFGKNVNLRTNWKNRLSCEKTPKAKNCIFGEQVRWHNCIQFAGFTTVYTPCGNATHARTWEVLGESVLLSAIVVEMVRHGFQNTILRWSIHEITYITWIQCCVVQHDLLSQQLYARLF